jgi:hypothetical protein
MIQAYYTLDDSILGTHDWSVSDWSVSYICTRCGLEAWKVRSMWHVEYLSYDEVLVRNIIE